MPELKIPARLDEVDALDLTIKLWKWIAKSGTKNKREWPGWDKIPFTFKFFCPLCQFVQDERPETCLEKCPWAKWKGLRCIDGFGETPTHYSAWLRAVDAEPSVRRAHARSFLAELKEVRKETTR